MKPSRTLLFTLLSVYLSIDSSCKNLFINIVWKHPLWIKNLFNLIVLNSLFGWCGWRYVVSGSNRRWHSGRYPGCSLSGSAGNVWHFTVWRIDRNCASRGERCPLLRSVNIIMKTLLIPIPHLTLFIILTKTSRCALFQTRNVGLGWQYGTRWRW